MAELTPDDVERYTSDRLAADDTETQRLLSAGLTAARRFCGWNVNLVEDDEVTLDGPGSTLLLLPTLRLVELTSVVENGVTLDVDTDLYVSARGLVRKRAGGCWSANYGSIVATMNHGFDDTDDFNAAVLSFVDRSSLTSTGGRPKAIGPFQYYDEAMAAASAFSAVERSLLEQYRLESAP
jgi:hypothetical protein